MTHQLLHLAREFPTYKRNIQAKVQSVYGPLATQLDKTSGAIQDLQGQFLAAQRRGPAPSGKS